MIYTDVFEYYENLFGSKFAAVNYIAKKARMISEEYDERILDSEAITIAIDESRREYVESTHSIKESKNEEDSIIESVLSLVSDTSVREAARLSIINSLYKQNLLYQYNKICDKNQKARVRVLTNMMWDKIMTCRIS